MKTTGGHSFADFGNVNAIERLSAIITELYQYKIPAGSAKNDIQRRYDLGGTTVNSIAAQAEMLYEMRARTIITRALWMPKAYFEKILEEFKAEGRETSRQSCSASALAATKRKSRPRQTALLTQCADAVENHFGTRGRSIQTATSRLQTAFLPRQSAFLRRCR